MTEKTKNRLLRKMKRNPMTRDNIKKFCKKREAFDCELEISSLHRDRIIKMISEPHWQKGLFVPKHDDLFAITDCGKDYLSNIHKESFRFYLPIAISAFALLVSIASFLVSLAMLIQSP